MRSSITHPKSGLLSGCLATICLIFLMPVFSFSQKIENLKAEVQGDKIIITYDLVQGYPGDKYVISLYSVRDNFSSALANASGDIGNGVIEGKAKRIVWGAKSELGDYKGELSFEVRAEIISPLSFLAKEHSARRGKSTRIEWRGGDKKKDVKIELLRAGAVILSMGSVTNKGTHEWQIPKDQKTGSDYQVRLTNGNEIVTTPLSIKHKIPLVVKVLPVVAVVIAIRLNSGKPSTDLDSPPDLGL